ncbi:MAG: type II toxin-antitoxin system prevent-host-death family antitoxin [Patescibacteria group bacterium]|nr:type II toxin-antitoxin system prevent-host-death family antitoxin [Patescibacteria group bacterium]
MFIATRQNTKSITDIREDAIGVFKEASNKGLLYVTYHSRPQAVIIDIDEFVSMQEMLENYRDELEAKKLLKEPRGKGVSLNQVIKMYE